MTSSLYVWQYLPGDTAPTLAGRVEVRKGAGKDVGSFIYAKSYLGNDRALPIDPVALPLEEREFETTMLGGHFSALLDAGPDAWGKRLIDRLTGVQSEYGYLLHLNGGQTGALAFSEESSHVPEDRAGAVSSTTLEELCEAAERVERGATIDEHWARVLDAGSSAGGARPKFNLHHNGRLWLAKLESVGDAGQEINIPLLEAGTLALARLCGIDTPEFILREAGRRKVLLVERFDRVAGDMGYSRLRYVSARTVFHSNPELQRWSYSGSYARFARELSRWSVSPTDDRQRLFRRMVFNCAVSNTDDHELNHGLIGDARGFTLSPAFDLVPQRSATKRRMQALLIGDEGAQASRSNLLSVAEVFGLEQDAAAAIIEEVRDIAAREWRNSLARFGAEQRMIQSLEFTFDSSHLDA